MSAPVRARLSEPLLQAPVVVAVAVCAYVVDMAAGLAAFAVMIAVWPPAVRWLPLAALRVAAVYLPFALCWFLFAAGYLRAMHALGVVIPPQPALQLLAEQGLGAPGAPLILLGIVVLAPLAEEILFRGYLWSALDALLSRRFVHAVNAALFGLVHGLEYALPIGALGLVFSWLRARHDALLPAVLAHAMHNGLTVAITLLWPGLLEMLYPR
jgi:membrane protease YdiL (CAAX protease family)